MNTFMNLLILINLLFSYSFLSNNQIKGISNILKFNYIYQTKYTLKNYNLLDNEYEKHYNISFSKIVDKSKQILFQHSLPFVHSKYNDFTRESTASKRLSNSDKKILITYGYIGLWKAIHKFNGSTNFYKYSNIYILSEFKRGLSDINTNYILPHRLRVNKQFLKVNNMSNFHVTSFSHIHSDYDKKIESEFRNYCSSESPEELYSILQMLTPKERNYFTYRYNIYTCKIHRTNKEVAQLMCVSEETARKEIIRITKFVVQMLQYIS